MNDKEPSKKEKIEILIIEDNHSDIDLIDLFLFEANFIDFNLSSALTFRKGLKCIENNDFDIILLDLSLPDVSDQRTIQLGLEKISNIPIIILTGRNDESFARKAIKEGIQDYLVKGTFDSHQLVRAINYAIDRFNLLKTNRILTQNLKKQEKKLRKLIDKIPESIIIINDDGNVKFVNPATETFFGINKDTLIGNYFEKISYLDSDGRLDIIKPDGVKKVAQLDSVNIQWEKENAFLLTLRDITQQVEYEKKIEESEKNYRDLFEKSPYPIAIINKTGELIDINSKLEKLIGYQKSEIIGFKYTSKDIFQIPSEGFFEEIVENLEQNDVSGPIKLRINNKQNEMLWIELDFSIINIKGENHIYIMIQDITKLVHSEKEVEKLEKVMHEMNALIEHAPLAIFLIHQSGKILRINEMTKELFELSESELLSNTIFNIFNGVNTEKLEKHYLEDIYDLATPNKIEVKIRTSDEEEKDIEITSTILKIADNIIIQSFVSDISKRKFFEKNRRLFLEQLQSSLEFKSKFLATISHELRTPLNAILGFSEILLEDDYGNLDNKQKEFVEDIYSAGGHLLTLINSILDLSKIEAGSFKLNPSKFNVNELIRDVLSVVNPLYSKKDLTVHVIGFDKKINLTADRFRFKQILFNLISNAIKFTNKGEILIKVSRKSQFWKFQIQDSGIGIDQKDYDIIFREFSRVEDNIVNDIPGVGLGLALTKRLVQLHGGRIWFESEKGKGSTFLFTIPFMNIEDVEIIKRSV